MRQQAASFLPKTAPEPSYRRNHGRVIVSVIAKSMTKSKATASLELSGSIQSCSIIKNLKLLYSIFFGMFC